MIVFDYIDKIMVILIQTVLVLRTINSTIVYLSTATTSTTADGIIMFNRLIKSIIICIINAADYNDILCGGIIAIMIVFYYTGNNMVFLIQTVLVLRTIIPTTVYLSTATANTTADGIIIFYPPGIK